MTVIGRKFHWPRGWPLKEPQNVRQWLKNVMVAGLMAPRVAYPSDAGPSPMQTPVPTSMGVDTTCVDDTGVVEWSGIQAIRLSPKAENVEPPDSVSVTVLGQDGQPRQVKVPAHYFRFQEIDGLIKAMPEGEFIRLKMFQQGVPYQYFDDQIHVAPPFLDLGFQVSISPEGEWVLQHRKEQAMLSAYVIANATHELMREACGFELPPIDIYPMADVVSIVRGELPQWPAMGQMTAEVQVGVDNVPAAVHLSVVGDVHQASIRPTNGSLDSLEITRLLRQFTRIYFQAGPTYEASLDSANQRLKEFVEKWDALEDKREKLFFVASCPDIVAHEVGHDVFRVLNGLGSQGAFGECFGDLTAVLVGLHDIGQNPADWKTSRYWPAISAGIAPELGNSEGGIRALKNKPTGQQIAHFDDLTPHEASEVPSYLFVEVLKKRLESEGGTIADIEHIRKAAAQWLAHSALFLPSDCAHGLADIVYAFIRADEALGSTFQAKELFQDMLLNVGEEGQALWKEVQWKCDDKTFTEEEYIEVVKVALESALEPIDRWPRIEEVTWSSGLTQERVYYLDQEGRPHVVSGVYKDGQLIFY